MRIPLVYLPKKKGGKLAHVATFTQSCNAYKDAEWIMDEGSFSFVGLSKQLQNTPLVVKLMEDNGLADKEIKAYKWFHLNPHPNIVQMICYFPCNDSPIRWVKSLCKVGEHTPLVVMIQDYIVNGDLNHHKNTLSLLQLKSIVSQLSYACFQLYDFGFYYGDWHGGNILIDTTTDKTITYRMGRKKIVIPTEGICPVLTDFGHSDWFDKEDEPIYHLTNMLTLLWILIKSFCTDNTWKEHLRIKSKSVGAVQSRKEAMEITQRLLRDLKTSS
jgi:serine/threonine protein kinase